MDETMEKLLVLTTTEAGGSLPKAAFEAVGVAKELASQLSGAELAIGLIGEAVQAGADALAEAGATKILAVEGADFAQPRYASDAAAAEGIAKAAEATVILAPGISRLNRVLAGVAHRLGGRIDTQVTRVDADAGAPVVSRWFYRQRMVARVTREARPWVISIDPGSVAAWQGTPGSAQVEKVDVSLPDSSKRTTVTGVSTPDVGEQTIRPEAELLMVAGAGWTKKQPDGQIHIDRAKDAILGFLRTADASLGSSKSLVDQASEGQATLPFLTHLNQVGQTGATPRHPKGLATCCHGEEPHVVGWRFVNERRAVNLDANCGWAQGKADVLYVADAFEVVEKVNALLAGQS